METRRKLCLRVSVVLTAVSLLATEPAMAETTLYKSPDGGWDFFADGRVNAFFAYANGDGYPRDVVNGHKIKGGGLSAVYAAEDDPASGGKTQGAINAMRISNGFMGNVLGFGMRRKLGDSTTAQAFISLWMHIESDDHRKYTPSYPDAREGYVRLTGDWGAFTAGRTLTLFSRGATEIDFLYGHGYGLGFPADLQHNGPASGNIGFGVLACGFASGLAYATPSLAGLQLNVGLYDPAKLQGSQYERTGWLRPEAELTYDASWSSGKLHLFANGSYQRVYQKDKPDSAGATTLGAGYGGRIELGPLHLGVAGHYGKGLGLNYALEASDATYSIPDQMGVSELRITDGAYAQAQLTLGRLDLNAGAGQTRVHLLESDRLADPLNPNDTLISVIISQLGLNAGVVYHATPWLHFDVDYFLARFKWQRGETQNVHFVNAGTTVTW